MSPWWEMERHFWKGNYQATDPCRSRSQYGPSLMTIENVTSDKTQISYTCIRILWNRLSEVLVLLGKVYRSAMHLHTLRIFGTVPIGNTFHTLILSKPVLKRRTSGYPKNAVIRHTSSSLLMLITQANQIKRCNLYRSKLLNYLP